MFKNKIAVITGGAQGIGRCIADEFRKQGASVCIIDKQPNEYFVGDISSEQVLRDFAGITVAANPSSGAAAAAWTTPAIPAAAAR